MNESCHTYEWVMSHICTSHVTHMNETHHRVFLGKWGVGAHFQTRMQIPRDQPTCKRCQQTLGSAWWHASYAQGSGVLQRVVAACCCSVLLQRVVAACCAWRSLTARFICSKIRCVAAYCNMLQSVLQRNLLQCLSACCHVLHCVVVCGMLKMRKDDGWWGDMSPDDGWWGDMSPDEVTCHLWHKRVSRVWHDMTPWRVSRDMTPSLVSRCITLSRVSRVSCLSLLEMRGTELRVQLVVAVCWSVW